MMRLAELAGILPDARVSGKTDIEITNIRYDSRLVKPGDLFVCIKGFKTDGHEFAREAVNRGAVALVVEPPIDVECPTVGCRAKVFVDDSRTALALLSSQFYHHPSRKLRLIGVTGTNGKTTTTHLIRHLLSMHGYEVGLIGTVHNVVCGDLLPVERTTPEAPDLQALFDQMLRCSTTHAVMEVSSHSLVLHRVLGCEFDCAVFTNITQDHLDFHKDFESYLKAKLRLFESLGASYHGKPKDGPKTAVINLDDPNGRRFIEAVGVQAITYGFSSGADVLASGMAMACDRTRFQIRAKGEQAMVEMPLVGRFNVYNAMAAVATCLGEGMSLQEAAEGLRKAPKVPGRFELVSDPNQPAVIVDYAHTPDGLENILKTAREFAKGRVIVVFGCGGDRDRSKRPKMGNIAGRYADYVILTSDNPRSENPDDIINEIIPGLEAISPDHSSYEVITDRREAIFRAISIARRQDIVVIAGKGHETYQIFKTRTIQFDDKEVAKEALKEVK